MFVKIVVILQPLRLKILMERRVIVMVLVSAVLLFSCNGRQQQSADMSSADSTETDTQAADTMPEDSMELLITETPMPQAADELFDDFLFNFVANKKLQMERVAFPLTTTRNGDTTAVKKEEWQMERLFMRQGYYTLLFGSKGEMALMNDTSLTEATVEKIYFNTGAVIQYQFHKIRGAWMLTRMDTQSITANQNASFLEFYHKFVCDTVFQCEHLESSVQFVGPDPDDDFEQMEGILTPDTWLAFAPELPDKMIYNIVYGKRPSRTNRMIFVLRGIANGLEMELIFNRHGDTWKLSKMTT